MDNKINAFEVIGIMIFIVFIVGILCLPGLITSDNVKRSYREEFINELCNNNDGKYDFCVLDKTTYHYIEKVNENE